MTVALSGFISTWSPAFSSTVARVERRNIGQGGNQLLAAIPQGTQAFWAGSVLAEVARVVSGPFYYLAQFFRLVFSPFIAYPLSVLACAVKERFYQSSIQVTMPAETKYFARGAEVPEEVLGTITVLIEREERHFHLSDDITLMMKNSVEVPEEGKRYHYTRLEENDAFDDRCREIQLDEGMVRVRLEWEVKPGTYTTVMCGGGKKYYRFGREVNEPLRGTAFVSEQGLQWVGTHYSIGEEIAEETPDCIKVEIKEQPLNYQTGIEIDAPIAGGRSFVIDGERRYFRSAKFIKNPYYGLSGGLNKLMEKLYLPPFLPTKLRLHTVQILELVNEHMSNVVRIALLVSGVALAYCGFYAMALGTLAAVSYEYLDHDLGVIPREVSLFMERWMPTISMCGLLIVGSFVSQIMAGSSLLIMIPDVNLYFHQVVAKKGREILLGVIDPIIARFVQNRPRQLEKLLEDAKTHPILEEYDAPLVHRKMMGLEELEGILERDIEDFELNPAHFTKNQEPILVLEENRSFNLLIDLWEGVGARWTEPATFERLIGRLVDDKRFILFIKERFPEAKLFHYTVNWRLTQEENRVQYAAGQREHRNQFIDWVDILAGEKGQTRNVFVANWVKSQLQFYVNKLSGNRPIEGEQRLLSEATQQTAQILPFLLRENATPVDIEDTLVKLAIEGGDYCSLAMGRASREVLDGLVEPLKVEATLRLGGQAAFESKVLLNLQKARHRILQGSYARVMGLFGDESLRDTAQDIHLYQAVTRALKRSFYPLSDNEMADFSIMDLAFKETIFMPVEVLLCQQYAKEIPNVMREVGINRENLVQNRTLEYLRTWVGESQILSAEEKEHLLNGSLSNGIDNMADPDNYPKWNSLLLTVLGVLRPKREVQEA